MEILKYPRTRHLGGSRRQKGDEDLEVVPVRALQGRHIVVEEKMDGANSGICFDPAGRLHLQSRGHFLRGGPRERQFTLFKQWATARAQDLEAVLGDRYVAYGEWLYSKHTIFYDALPHYWLEFDVYDRSRGAFLDTPSRAALLRGLPVTSVKVLWSGVAGREPDLKALIGPSRFITPGRAEALREACGRRGLDFETVRRQTDLTGRMEGLYVKVEEDGVVRERYKLVRADFLNLILENDEHHLDRPIVPNQLAAGVELFAR